MNILSVASEVFPLIKTGGLADVAGALPLALAPLGIAMRTILPGYPSVLVQLKDAHKIADLPDLLGAPASILKARHAGLDLYVIDCATFYDRPGGPYTGPDGRDHDDNWRRFAALAKAASEIANGADPSWRPDIVHAHDWQAALTPVYLKYSTAGTSTPSMLTIHNIAFQGQFAPSVFGGLQLPPEAFAVDGIEYYGDVGFLKGGCRTAWQLTTVSPTYAEELLDPQFGMGLEGLIAERVSELAGIVNGIDDKIWDPENDTLIAAPFNAGNLKRRSENRKALVKAFGLEDNGGPLFCVISRLTWQKGIDMIARAADFIAAHGGMLAVLGNGDPGLEYSLTSAAERHPGRISARIGYDEPLSHLMQAGADSILIPSRFEPCGLTQLYGLRYGCIPVVARTGGLNDTIIDANGAALAAKAATGIQFSPVNIHGFMQALRRTFRLFADQKTWQQMQKAAMKSDVTWAASATQYSSLYQKLLARVP
jgi:starch synthase